jgi:ABC-type bacteriocin/lantibiotic exporter with double-glycine peptidase domain
LIQRLYRPDRGQILMDGIDISQVDTSWLRRQIGVVLQENMLFNRTIHETLRSPIPACRALRLLRPPAKPVPMNSSPGCRWATTR